MQRFLRPLRTTYYVLRTRSAFTLIEMLIVVGITSMLAGAILTYTSSSRDRVALSVEEAKLAQTISRAKSLALTTYARENIPCGYGVTIDYDTNSYELFAYEPLLDEPDGKNKCSSITMLEETGKSERESFLLPPNIIFKEEEGAPLESVLFIPPDPKTWIWRRDETATSTTGVVYLTSRAGTSPMKIEVGAGGQVSF